jgi:hypothetical protein
MPTFDIQTPGGRVLTIEAPDQETAIRGAQEWHTTQGTQGKKTGYLSNLAAGANDVIASTAGLPVDLMTGAMNLGSRGINAMAGTNIPPINSPMGGSASIKGLMGMIGADPREVVPASRGEELARAGAQGAAGAVVPGGIARALPQAAGPALGAVQQAIGAGASPGAAAVSGAAGVAGNVAEQYAPDPLKPAANMAAQVGTGVGAGLAQRAGGGLLDSMLGVNSVPRDRAMLARRMVDDYQLPLTASDIQGGTGPVRWAQSALDYLPFSGARGRQNALQEAINRNLTKAVGGDDAGREANRFTYDVAQGAKDRIGGQYTQALDGVTIPFMGGHQFGQLRNQIGQSTLNPSEQRALGMTMQNIERVAQQNGGQLSGRDYQAFRMRGSGLDNLMGDANPTVQKFAREIRNALDANFGLAAPPGKADLYNLSNQQYRTLMALSPEIAKGEPGNITAGNIQNAANRAYPRRAFDRGPNAVGDLGDAAKSFLRRLPESGTAPRAGMMGGLQAMAGGEFLPGAAALAGMGAPTAAGAMMGPMGLLGVIGGGRMANSAINSKFVREALLNRVLNPPAAPPIVPPWMLGSIPAQAAQEGR